MWLAKKERFLERAAIIIYRCFLLRVSSTVKSAVDRYLIPFGFGFRISDLDLF